MDKIKLYCVVAKESVDKMKGSRGKLIAQAGHAFVHAVWDAEKRFPQSVYDYKNSGKAFKIGLVVPTVADLEALEASYRDICGVALIQDAGITIFNEPTITCLGIGPIRESQMKTDLTSLKGFI